jgi:hypothetical protein
MTVQTTTTSPASVDLAERIGRLMRELGAALGELVDLAAVYGYELPEAVQLAAAVMPRPGEPDPERCKRYNDWLDRIWQTNPGRANLIKNVMDLCTPVDVGPRVAMGDAGMAALYGRPGPGSGGHGVPRRRLLERGVNA